MSLLFPVSTRGRARAHTVSDTGTTRTKTCTQRAASWALIRRCLQAGSFEGVFPPASSAHSPRTAKLDSAWLALWHANKPSIAACAWVLLHLMPLPGLLPGRLLLASLSHTPAASTTRARASCRPRPFVVRAVFTPPSSRCLETLS